MSPLFPEPCPSVLPVTCEMECTRPCPSATNWNIVSTAQASSLLLGSHSLFPALASRRFLSKPAPSHGLTLIVHGQVNAAFAPASPFANNLAVCNNGETATPGPPGKSLMGYLPVRYPLPPALIGSTINTHVGLVHKRSARHRSALTSALGPADGAL